MNFSREEEEEWNLNSREKRVYFLHVILMVLRGRNMPFGVKRLVMCRFGQGHLWSRPLCLYGGKIIECTTCFLCKYAHRIIHVIKYKS